jgi:hypothetical protein
MGCKRLAVEVILTVCCLSRLPVSTA